MSLSEATYELEIESLVNRFHADLGEITKIANKTEIEYLREMHRIGQSLIGFAKGGSRELSDQLCKIVGPEISKRNRG